MNVLRRQTRAVSVEEERSIREHIEGWLVSSSGYTHGKRLHIPDNERPLCESLDKATTTTEPTENQAGTDFMHKSCAQIPLGYWDVCELCGYAWRNSRPE